MHSIHISQINRAHINAVTLAVVMERARANAIYLDDLYLSDNSDRDAMLVFASEKHLNAKEKDEFKAFVRSTFRS